MGKLNFDTWEPKKTATYDKFSLDKGQQARVCWVDQNAINVFVHNFDRIKLGEDNEPILVHGKWPDGKPHDYYDSEYVGKYRCTGDEDVVRLQGADAENCSACMAAIQYPNAFKKATERILANILVYSTKPNSFDLQKPFSAKLVVWDLTSGRFKPLQAMFKEHGNLAKKDLLIGPCENAKMQKYTIIMGNDALWLSNAKDQEFVLELMQEQMVTDLEEAAGKLPTDMEMQVKVAEVLRAYNHAFPGVYSSLGGEKSVLDDPTEVIAKKRKKAKVEEPVKPVDDDEDDEDDEDDDGDDMDTSEDDEDEGDEESADPVVGIDQLLAMQFAKKK